MRLIQQIGFIFICYLISSFCCHNVTNVMDQKSNVNENNALHLQDDNKDFWTSFISSFTLIFISEIGDKTFFLVMIYSLSNSLLKTFLVNAFAMSFMTIAAVVLGASFSMFLNKTIINIVALFVFAGFAGKMFHSAATKESKLIEDKFISKLNKMEKKNPKKVDDNEVIEKNKDLEAPLLDNKKNESRLLGDTWQFITALTIGELGDGSQVATVVMAASQNFYGVLAGGCLAHMCDSLVAMILGNLIAKHLTTKQIYICGGVTFTVFSISYLIQLFGYSLL